MKVDFHLPYSMSRLRNLTAACRKKMLDLESGGLPRLSELCLGLRRPYIYHSRELARLNDALKFCQRLGSYRRGIRERVALLAKSMSDFTIEIASSNQGIITNAARSRLEFFSKAADGIRESLGYYGDKPISLCIVGYEINRWKEHSQPNGGGASAGSNAQSHSSPGNKATTGLSGALKEFSQRISDQVTSAQQVQDAFQFLLTDVIAMHEKDCKLIEDATCRIEADISSTRNILSTYATSHQEHALEYDSAKSALKRFFEFRIAEMQAWKRFEETLFRSV